jgi:hypothetical protein
LGEIFPFLVDTDDRDDARDWVESERDRWPVVKGMGILPIFMTFSDGDKTAGRAT